MFKNIYLTTTVKKGCIYKSNNLTVTIQIWTHVLCTYRFAGARDNNKRHNFVSRRKIILSSRPTHSSPSVPHDASLLRS